MLYSSLTLTMTSASVGKAIQASCLRIQMLYGLGYCLLSHYTDVVWVVMLPPVSRHRCCTGCVIASCLRIQMLYRLHFSLLSQDTDAVQAGLLPPFSRYRCCTGWVIASRLRIQMLYGLCYYYLWRHECYFWEQMLWTNFLGWSPWHPGTLPSADLGV